jgi:hypothetical protein
MFSLLLLTTLNVQASTVTIKDQAGVLNAERVQAEGAKLPVPVLIYTTKTFNGDQDALNQYTREQLPNQNAIAIGIDTVHRHLSIESGTSVQLSDSQASDALSAFQNNFNGGDYTGATVAAIDSLQNTLSGGGSSGGGITPLGVAVAILLCLALVVFVVIVIIRRKTGGNDGPPRGGGKRTMGPLYTPYPYYGANHPISAPPPTQSGNYGGGAGGSFGGGSSGGGAGGNF